MHASSVKCQKWETEMRKRLWRNQASKPGDTLTCGDLNATNPVTAV